MSSTPKPKLPSAELCPPGGSARPPARRVDPPSVWPASTASARDFELAGVTSGVGRKHLPFEGPASARSGQREHDLVRPESERQGTWRTRRSLERLPTAADALPPSRRSFQHTSMELRAPIGSPAQQAGEGSTSVNAQPLPEQVVHYGTEPSPESDGAMAMPIPPDRVASYGIYEAVEPGVLPQRAEGDPSARVGVPGLRTTLPNTSGPLEASARKPFAAYGKGAGGYGAGFGAATGGYVARPGGYYDAVAAGTSDGSGVSEGASGGYGALPGRASGGYGAPPGRASRGYGAVPGTASGGSGAAVGHGRASGGFGSIPGGFGAPTGVGPHASGAHAAVGGAHPAAAGFDAQAGRVGGALGARPSVEMQGRGMLGPSLVSSRLSGSFEAPLRPSGASFGAAGAGERISLEMAASSTPHAARSSASHLAHYPSGFSPHSAAARGSGVTRWQLAAMAASFAFSLLLVLLAIERPQAREAPYGAAGAVERVAPSASFSPELCVISQVPERLALDVERRVPVEVVDRGKQLMLGFAEARGTAIGMVWSPGGNRPRVAYREHPRAAVQGVAPVLSLLQDDFHVDTAEAPEVLRTFGGQERLQVVSVPGELYVRRSEGPLEHRLWSAPGAFGGRPRVLELDSNRYALATRQDGPAGRVLVGTFHGDGDEPAHSFTVPFETGAFGAPALASREKHLVVAVASQRDGRASGLLLAMLQNGSDGLSLLHQVHLTPSTGTRWSDPQLTALRGDGWLLQWTEQREGGSEVRVRTLDSQLQPVGAELLVSPRGASALAASIVGHELPSVFYFLASGAEYELWVQALHCD